MTRQRLAFTVLAALGTLVGPARADGPGLPNEPYTAEELFTTLSLIQYEQGIVTVALHKGYLFVPFALDEEDPRGGFAFWNVFDARSPVEVLRVENPDSQELREPQGFAFLRHGEEHRIVLQAKRGVQIWNVTDPLAPFRESYLDLGVDGTQGTGVWWVSAQGSRVYAGGQDDGLFVIDASDPTDPTVIAHRSTEELQGVVPASAFALGNQLLVAGSFNRRGYALLDASDPANPVLLGADAGPAMPENHGVNFDGRLVYGAGSDDALHIHRVSPTGTFTEVSSLPTEGKGGFATPQERAVHFGASRSYHKISVADPANPVIVGSAAPPVPGSDWDAGTPLGNLVFVAADNTGSGALVPHQEAPDTAAPRVLAVSPRRNATNQALTASVGVAFNELIDAGSVGAGSFVVRPAGGQALAGTYSVAFGIVNFTPDAPLAPGTTYEVGLPAGGIADYVGNPLAATFASRFTTAAQ